MNTFKFNSDDVVVTQKTIKVAKLVVSHAVLARREGILAVEDGLSRPDLEDPYLTNHEIDGLEEKIYAHLLAMMVDGVDGEMILKAAGYLLNNIPLSNKEERFNAMIITEGILMIQAGNNPGMIIEILTCMMGLEKGKDLKKIIRESGIWKY